MSDTPSAKHIPSIRDTKAQAKKDYIIEEARKLFLKQGYSGTSLDQLAREAGVSKMTIYRHFRDKEDLFIEIINRTCDQIYDMASYPVARDRAELEHRLHEFGNIFFETVTAPEVFLFYRMLIGEMSRFPELGAKFYAVGPARSLALIAHILSGLMGEEEAELKANAYLHLVLGDAFQAYTLGQLTREQARPLFRKQVDMAVRLLSADLTDRA